MYLPYPIYIYSFRYVYKKHLTFFTGFLALVWYPGAEISTVTIHVIAGVGGCWLHPWPKATTLATNSLYLRLPAKVLGQLCTITKEVCAAASGGGAAGCCLHSGGGGSCSGSTGGPISLAATETIMLINLTSFSSAPESDQCSSNTTHLHTSLNPDESLLTPARAPGVLDKPIIYTIFTAIPKLIFDKICHVHY